MATKQDKKQVKISNVEITKDKMSGRGGLFFFLREVENIGFYSFFENHFHFLRFSGKKLPLIQFTRQMTASFIDDSDRFLTGFGRRKSDEGYAAILRNTTGTNGSIAPDQTVFSSINACSQFS